MQRLLFFVFLFTAQVLCAKHQRLNLQKAVDLKLVKAQAQSTGAYQDYCINLNLKNMSPDSLIVTVEPGRRLNSLTESDQDILVTKEELIVLAKGEEKWFPVKGFCCQANNHAPKKGAKYSINTLADSNLVKVARYLSTRNFDMHVTQEAIWAISDNRPTAQIAGKNDSLIAPLRYFVAGIKGEPIPWYTIISKTFVFSSGAMENYPLYLRGKLNYTNDKECYSTLQVLDAKGNIVSDIVQQWIMPGTRDYDLNIPVKGLAKGKYTVELVTAQKQLVKKEFEI